MPDGDNRRIRESPPQRRQAQSRTLELLRVAGTHRGVGEQIGAACSGAIRRRCDGVGDATVAAAQPYLSVPIQTPQGYHANDSSAADLDGDGEYEIVVHMGRP